MSVMSLLAVPAALNQTLEVIEKIRSKKKVTKIELDSVTGSSEAMMKLVGEILAHLDRLDRWKFLHHVTQKILFVERKNEFEIVIDTKRDFGRELPRNEDLFRALAADHRSAMQPNGSGLDISSQDPTKQAVPGLIEAKIINDGEVWQDRYYAFMAQADEFYGDGNELKGQATATLFAQQALEFNELLGRLNHYADTKILLEITELNKLCITN